MQGGLTFLGGSGAVQADVSFTLTSWRRGAAAQSEMRCDMTAKRGAELDRGERIIASGHGGHLAVRGSARRGTSRGRRGSRRR